MNRSSLSSRTGLSLECLFHSTRRRLSSLYSLVVILRVSEALIQITRELSCECTFQLTIQVVKHERQSFGDCKTSSVRRYARTMRLASAAMTSARNVPDVDVLGAGYVDVRDIPCACNYCRGLAHGPCPSSYAAGFRKITADVACH